MPTPRTLSLFCSTAISIVSPPQLFKDKLVKERDKIKENSWKVQHSVAVHFSKQRSWRYANNSIVRKSGAPRFKPGAAG